MTAFSQTLDAVARGDPQAAAELLPMVYDELRRLAAQKLAQEKAGQTIQATALVHEAYLRLVDGGREQRWDHRGHFFAAAAEAMRRILVENARRKRNLKSGGGLVRHDLNEGELAAPEPDGDLLVLDEALERLATRDPLKAEVVKLRYFAGLSSEETALALGISRASVDRYWNYARAWLFRDISGQKNLE